MKNYNFQKLEPKGVLTWFKKICSIPHGTHNEAQLSKTLMEALNKAGCWVKQFSSGALLVRKAATKGFEKKPMICFQAHMDMVLVKEPYVKIDLLKEPIKPYYDSKDKCIKCDGTTLGSDDGVGVACIMELMTGKYPHGPIEALITVCEEGDVGYCMNSLPQNVLKAKHMINLDIDLPDRMYVASIGTMEVSFERKLKYLPIPKKTKTYHVSVSGLDGGHSGLMIHNPINNAIAFLSEALYSFAQEHNKIRLVSMDGGLLMNSIATKADFVVQIDPKDADELKRHVQHAWNNARTLAQGLDKNGKVSVKPAKKQSKVACSVEETEKILFFYGFLPNGVYRMDITMKHVFACGNIGVVKTAKDTIYTVCLPRSFSTPDLDRQFNMIRYFGSQAGMTNFKRLTHCPPWLTKSVETSTIIQAWTKAFHKATGKYTFPARASGGLETAELITKCPQLDEHCVAVGPRIREEHSTRERVELDSIKELWKTILQVLKEIK